MVAKKAAFSLTLDMDLIQQIEELAAKEERTRSWMVNKLLEEGLAVHGKRNGRT